MTTRNLKRLGLCLALALLCAALLGFSALAEGDPALEGLGIRLSDTAVLPTDEVDIYYEPAYGADVDPEDIEYSLEIYTIGEDDAPVDVSDIAPAYRCFTVPANRFEPGRAYRAFIRAEADGYEGQEVWRDFVVVASNPNYRVDLDVDGEMIELALRTTEEVSINIHAPGAQEVILGNGHGFEQNLADWGYWDDFSHCDIRYFWDYETCATVYARARFVDPYTKEEFWVTSNPVTLNVRPDDDEPLPAPVITWTNDTASRGEHVAFTASTDGLPEDLEDLRLLVQVFVDDEAGEYRQEDEFWPDGEGHITAAIRTAELTPGAYRIRCQWRAVGRVAEEPEEPGRFTVTDYEGDGPLFAAEKDEVVPHEEYFLYAFAPDAEGLCVYEGWEIREIFEGADSFTWSDGSGEIEDRTYYLGVWNADEETWERTDKSVTIHIATDARLPEPIVDGLEAIESGFLQEGDALELTVNMLDHEVYNPDELWYDVFVTDETDNYDLVQRTGFHLYPDEDEDEYDPSRESVFIESNHFQVGHVYTVRIYAGCYGYPMSKLERRFIVRPGGDGNEVTLTIEGDDVDDDNENQLTVAPNAMNALTLNAPGATAAQLYWDYGWQNVDPEYYSEDDEEWRWSWSLEGEGDQFICARVTYDPVNWDADVNWDTLNWTAYSEAQLVSVSEGVQVAVPEVSLESNALTRGDMLRVIIGERPEGVTGYGVQVFSRNEEGDFWDHAEGEYHELDESEYSGYIFELPTINLERDEYRVQVNVSAEQGYVGNSTDYDQPGLRFTLSPAESDVLTVWGNSVEFNDGEGAYLAPVHAEYHVSAYVEGASALCLYEDGERVDEWWNAESFDWSHSSGYREEHEYTVGQWSDEVDDWVDVEDISARVIITAEGDELDPAEIDCAPAVPQGDAFSFTFSEVDNAGWYYVTVRDANDEWDDVYQEDIAAFTEEDGVEPGARHEVSLSTENLNPNTEYVIRVHAFQEGRSGSFADRRFLVLYSNDEPTQPVSLTLDNLVEEDENFYVNQDVELTLTSEGHVSFAEIFWDHEWERADASVEYDTETDTSTLVWNMRTGERATQTVVASVYYLDEHPNAYSNAESVTFTSRRDLQLPGISLEDTELTRGDKLRVRLGAPSEEDREFITGYELMIFDAEGDDRWSPHYSESFDAAAATVELPTIELQPGRYRVHLNQHVEDGYYSDGTDEYDSSLWFTVNGLEEDAPFLYATKAGDGTRYTGAMSVLTMEEYELNGYVPGAADVAILRNGESAVETYNDGVRTDERWPNPGTYTYTLAQWDNDKEDWQAVEGVQLTVTVKKKTGGRDLAAPVIEAPAVISCGGEPIELTVKPGDNYTDTLHVRVNCDDAWDDEPLYETRSVSGTGDVQTFSLPTEDLLPGGEYIIHADAWGAGHNGSEAETRFVVSGEADEGVTLTVNGKSDAAALSASKNYDIRISAARYDEENYLPPTRVELFWDGGWRTIDPDEEESFEDFENGIIRQDRLNGGSYTAMVRATWDGYDWDNFDWEEIDYNRDINWRYSNAVALNVTSSGQVPMPASIRLSKNKLDPGATLGVTLSGLKPSVLTNRADGIHISIHRLNDDTQFYWVDKGLPASNETSKTYTINLGNLGDDWEPLRPGRYRVHVHVNGKEGYDSAWTDGWDESLWFTVNNVFGLQAWEDWDEENQEDIWSEPTKQITVNTHDPLRIHCETPEGEAYCLYNGNEREEEWDGGSFDVNLGMPNAGTFTYYLGTMDGNGRWYRMDETELTVTVKGDEGTLNAPVFTDVPKILPATVDENGDTVDQSFSFTFEGVDNAGWYNVQVRDDDGWKPVYEEDFNLDPDAEDNPDSIVVNEDGTYTVTVAAPRNIFEYDEETDTEELVDTYHILPGHQYVIQVNAFQSGWSSGEAEARVICPGNMGEGDEAIELTLDPVTVQGDEGEYVPVGADVNVHISVPNRTKEDEEDPDTMVYVAPKAVQIFWGDWQNLDWDSLGEDFDGDFSDLNFTWEALRGNNVVMVRATWDEFWWDEIEDMNRDINWTYSNPVTLNAVSSGRVELPEYSLNLAENRWVSRGQPVELWIGAKPEHVRNYHVRIRRLNDWNDELYFNEYDVDDGTILLPTDSLNAYEDYIVEILARGEIGWEDNGTSELDESLRFHVKYSSESSFFADKESVTTGENFMLSAYVPGAEGLRFVRSDDENDQRDNGGGNNLWENYSMDSAGDYTFILEQRYSDDNWMNVGECTVHVEAPEGDLAETDIILPGAFTANGNDLTFTIEVDENAEYVNVRFERDGQYGEESVELLHYDNTAEREFTIPADQLEPGCSYTASVYASAFGYNAAWNERTVMVVPSSEDGEPTMRLTVNGSDEAIEVLSNEEYEIHFWVDVPDGYQGDDPDEPVCTTNQQLFWDGEWRDMWPGEDFGDDPMDGVFTRRDNSTVRTVAMRASFDECNTWIYSNAVAVTIVSEGDLPEPNVELTGLNEDRAIARGDDLVVRVTVPMEREQLDENGDPILDEEGNPVYETVDNRDCVDNINFAIFAPNEQGDFEEEVFNLNLGGDTTEATLSTLALDPGRYFLEVWVGGVPGWNSNGTNRNDEAMFFEVTENDIENPVLTLSQDTARLHERVAVTAFVPGDGRVAIFRDGEYVREAERVAVHTEEFDRSGEYTYQLAVWNDALDQWRVLDIDGCVRTLTVESDGELDPPVVEGIPATLTRDSDLEFTLAPVENGESYHLNLHVTDNWEDSVFERDVDSYSDEFNEDDGLFHFTVDAGEFDRFPAGTRLELSAWSDASAYDTAQADCRFLLVDANEGETSVDLTIDPTEVPINADTHIAVETNMENPTYAQIYLDGDWRDLWLGDIDGESYASFSIDHAFGQPGEQSVVVRVTDYGDIENYEGPWDELSGWVYSDPVVMSVTREGALPEVTAALSANALRRGENLTVSFSLGEDDARDNVDHIDVAVYGFDYDNPDEGYWREVDRQYYEGNATEVIIPTAGLDEDTYRIQVRALGKPGWENSETDNDAEALFFRVKKPIDTRITFTATKTEVGTWESYGISAIVPGASRLQLLKNGEVFRHWDEDSEIDYWIGDRLGVNGINEDWAGIYRYTLKAFDGNGDPITLEYDPVTVTVTSNGDLAAPEVTYDATPTAGEPFAFTVKAVEYGDRYNIGVFEADAENPVWDYEGNLWNEEGGVLHGEISEGLETGTTYWIRVWVGGAGWTSNYKEYSFTPVAAENRQLTLTLLSAIANDDPEEGFHPGEPLVPEGDAYRIRSQQPFFVRVTCEEGLEDVRLSWDDHLEELNWDETAEAWTGQFSSDSGRRTLTAWATLNGDEVYSDSVTLVIEGETLARPTATLNTNRGRILNTDTLTVKLNADWNKVAEYGVVLHGTNPDDRDTDYSEYVTVTEGAFENDTVTFDMEALLKGDSANDYILTPVLGAEYRVQIDARAKEGYDNSGSDPNDDGLYLTPIEPLGEVTFDFIREPEPLLFTDEMLSFVAPMRRRVEAYKIQAFALHNDAWIMNGYTENGEFMTSILGEGSYRLVITPVTEWGYTPVPQERILHIISADAPRMTLPNAVTTIEEEAFSGNTAIRIVDLRGRDSIDIGARAFQGCANLALVLLPDSGVTFGDACFDEGVVFYCGANSATETQLKDAGYTVRTAALPDSF